MNTTIYILDQGYGGTNSVVTGDINQHSPHGTIMADTVSAINPRAHIHALAMPQCGTIDLVVEKISWLSEKVQSDDLVLFGWVSHHNLEVDQAVTDLAQRCMVVVPAGNMASHIRHFSPTVVSGVTTVVALNGKNQLMSLSNYGCDQCPTVGMYGVPMPHLGHVERGTSVAAAIYAGLMSRNRSEKFIRRSRQVIWRSFQ